MYSTQNLRFWPRITPEIDNVRCSLCARILEAGRDGGARFSLDIQRDMQSRLRESRLSFSNAERVELCTISASLANIGGGAGGGRQPALSDSLDLSILKGHRFRFPLEIEHRF